MKSPAERGRVGAWAYEARADADLSVEAVVERLARAGQPVAAATLRGIEGGSKQPSRRLLKALAGVYGRPVPGDNMAGDVLTTSPAITDYLSRIDSLVATVTELVGELRATRQDRDDLLERVGALEAAARLRVPSSAGAVADTTAPAQRGE